MVDPLKSYSSPCLVTLQNLVAIYDIRRGRLLGTKNWGTSAPTLKLQEVFDRKSNVDFVRFRSSEWA